MVIRLGPVEEDEDDFDDDESASSDDDFFEKLYRLASPDNLYAARMVRYYEQERNKRLRTRVDSWLSSSVTS